MIDKKEMRPSRELGRKGIAGITINLDEATHGNPKACAEQKSPKSLPSSLDHWYRVPLIALLILLSLLYFRWLGYFL